MLAGWWALGTHCLPSSLWELASHWPPLVSEAGTATASSECDTQDLASKAPFLALIKLRCIPTCDSCKDVFSLQLNVGILKLHGLHFKDFFFNLLSLYCTMVVLWESIWPSNSLKLILWASLGHILLAFGTEPCLWLHFCSCFCQKLPPKKIRQ